MLLSLSLLSDNKDNHHIISTYKSVQLSTLQHNNIHIILVISFSSNVLYPYKSKTPNFKAGPTHFFKQQCNSDKNEKVQRRPAKFVKSMYGRHSSVSEMLDELGWPSLSQRRHETSLILFYKIINGLAGLPLTASFLGPIGAQEVNTIKTKLKYEIISLEIL